MTSLELVVGFEPTTCGLRNRCSTAELHQHEQASQYTKKAYGEQRLFTIWIRRIAKGCPNQQTSELHNTREREPIWHLTFTLEDCTIQLSISPQMFCCIIHQSTGGCMKLINSPQKGLQKMNRKLLKSLMISNRHLHHLQERNNRRLRIVRSATAGHVRGGHSFH